MQKFRSGKAVVSTLVVLLWVGLIGGGVFWYVKNEESKAKAKAEEQKRIEDEEYAKAPKLKGLSMPPLQVPKGEVPVERTEPFKYVFSDMPSTMAKAGSPDLNVKYSDSKMSDEEFSAGMTGYLLEGVTHFEKSNESPNTEELAALLKKIVEASQQPDADLKSFFKEIEPFAVGEKASGDPFAQHVAGQVFLANGDKVLAQQLFLGAIQDYRKYDYPSRFSVLAFTQRANTEPRKMPTFSIEEQHVDAMAHWLQNDFSESGTEHRYCWSILKASIASLAKTGKIEIVKKLMDKNEEKPFISPWLAEMFSAQYYIQYGKVNFASDEVIENAKKHLNAAIEINSNFPEPTEDLKVVAEFKSP